MAVGSAKLVTNGQDTFGGHLFGVADYNGPAAYVQGGDQIDPHIFGFPNTILTLIASTTDQSVKFVADPRPLQNGVTPWNLVWTSLTSLSVGGQTQVAGQEAVAGTNLSTFTVRLSAIGY